MLIFRNGHAMAAMLGVLLAFVAITAVAEEVNGLRPPRNAADVIRGYGGPDGLRQSDIQTYIALTRADARAFALSQLIRSDLDANGALSKAEMETFAHSLSARARARFGRAVEAADQDLDGAISPTEFVASGEAAAIEALNGEDEAAFLGLLALDSDGNNAVDLTELRDGLARSGAKAGASAKPKKKDGDA